VLPRTQVVESYREIGKSLAPLSGVFELLHELPPFLCQRLALENRVTEAEVNRFTAYAGRAKPTLDWWRSLAGGTIGLLSGAGFEGLVSELPLAGHRAATRVHALNAKTVKVLENLQDSDPGRSKQIEDWTSLIVWVERNPGSNATLLTSSTFPLLPHCTFLSQKALRHVPPNSVFSRDSNYALKENLFHEALHQELAAALLHRQILSEDYWADNSERVAVPWRGASWEPDRVLHAVYVYATLLPMRAEALATAADEQESKWLESALSEGRTALEYLLGRLLACKSLFSAEGEAVRQEIVGCANSSLGRSLQSR
jgi:hypothetical protein